MLSHYRYYRRYKATCFIGVCERLVLLKQLRPLPDELRAVGPAGHPVRQEVADQLAADGVCPSEQPDGDLSDQQGEHIIKSDKLLPQHTHPAVAPPARRPAVHGQEGRLEHDGVTELVHVVCPPVAPLLLPEVVLPKHQHEVTHHALCQRGEVISLEEVEGALDLLVQVGELPADDRRVAKGHGGHLVGELVEVQLPAVLDDVRIQ